MQPFVIVDATLVRPDPSGLCVRVEPGRSVVVADGRVAKVSDAPVAGLVRVEARGRLLSPGLVDAHTHATFLGDRAAEFCARAAGASYLELAEAGGGIAATVRATRAGTPEERLSRTRVRLRRLAANGVTTVEVKTGYGLSAAHELALLEELAQVQAADLPRLLPTLMAAHAFAPELGSPAPPEARAAWVRTIADALVPEAARRGLAGRVDVFVEQTAYSHDEARTIARATRAAGLDLHLHVDQLSSGEGAELAAELGAKAVAHLERTTAQGISALARAGTVAVLLPTATLAAREPRYAPARALVEAGVPIALSTNLNPGTGPTESTSLMFFLAAVALGLRPEEWFWAATRGGARALGLEAGLLEEGAAADLVLWNAGDLAHLAYHAAVNHVACVWRAGRVLVDRAAAAEADCDGML